MKLDRMLIPGNVELRADGADGETLTGHAAVFFRTDDTSNTQYQIKGSDKPIMERIHRSAFDEALSRGDDVVGLFNHDQSQLLGRSSSGTMKLIRDRMGLRYEIKLGDTTAARDVRENIRRGDIRGSSFGFEPDQVDWKEERDHYVRTLRSVRLFDVGPVTFPAYRGTDVNFRSALKDEYELWMKEIEISREEQNAGRNLLELEDRLLAIAETL
jgi:HK97 family phage prohead protease